MRVAGTELVTSQEIKTLCKGGNNLNVPTTRAELVTKDKRLPQTQQIHGHVLPLPHQIHGRCC